MTPQTTQITKEALEHTAPLNIVNVMLWMQRNAYEASTIAKVAKLLRHLQKYCNTSEPEEVKNYVSKKHCSNAHKENLIEAYSCYMKSENRYWDKPFYARYDKKRRAPKEELVDFLINHARIEMALKLSMSKDLGTRPIELTWLTLRDIDLTSGLVSITGAKHTVGRDGQLKNKSLTLLKIYIKKKKLGSSAKLFS